MKSRSVELAKRSERKVLSHQLCSCLKKLSLLDRIQGVVEPIRNSSHTPWARQKPCPRCFYISETMYLRKHGVSVSHRPDALYQGTALAAPHRRNYDWAL